MDGEKELWGHRFKIVNNGLDEGQVYSFVESLSNQYGQFSRKLEELDTAISRLTESYSALAHKLDVHPAPGGSLSTQGHAHRPAEDSSQHPRLSGNGSDHAIYSNGDRLVYLDSLTRFAESTVIEAARQSLRIKTEMEDKAKAHAASIIAQARDNAQAEIDRMVNEAEAKARAKANDILAAAEEKANSLLQAAGRDAEAVRTRYEGTEAPPVQTSEDPALVLQAKEQLNLLVQAIEAEKQRLLASTKKPGEAEIKQLFSNIFLNMESLAGLLGEDLPSELPGSEQAEASPDEGKRPSQDGKNKGADSLFDGTVELALPPPVGLDRMLQLHKHLKQTPNVDVLNLGGSVDKGITIRILVESPTPLLKIIGELPEVSSVTEENPGGDKVVPARKEDGSPIRRIIVGTKT